MASLAFTFARMNPPTIGHEHLVGVLKKFWPANDRRVFLSASQDDDRNPLPFGYKHSLVKKAFQDIDVIVSDIPQKDFFACLKFISELGYSEIDVLVGADRVEELQKRIPMYNGQLYYFSRAQVHSVGPRIKGGDGVEGMSASLMRKAAKLGDYATFECGLPTKLRPMARDIFEEVRCHSKGLVSTA